MRNFVRSRKGVAFRDTLLAFKDHPMNRICKDLQGQPKTEQTVRNTVQKPHDWLSVKRCRGVVKHDTPAFFQCVSTRRFLSSISPVQLSPCAFTRFVCTMQKTRKPAMACNNFAAFAGCRCRASGYRLATDRAGE